MEIKRISGFDGKLLALNVDGRIIERDLHKDDNLTMRRLEIDLLERVLVCERDTVTMAAQSIMQDYFELKQQEVRLQTETDMIEG